MLWNGESRLVMLARFGGGIWGIYGMAAWPESTEEAIVNFSIQTADSKVLQEARFGTSSCSMFGNAELAEDCSWMGRV